MSDSKESMLDLPPADNAWKSKVLTRKVFDKSASAEKFRKAKIRNHLKMQDFGSISDNSRKKDHMVNLNPTLTGLKGKGGGGGGNNSCNHGMLD